METSCEEGGQQVWGRLRRGSGRGAFNVGGGVMSFKQGWGMCGKGAHPTATVHSLPPPHLTVYPLCKSSPASPRPQSNSSQVLSTLYKPTVHAIHTSFWHSRLLHPQHSSPPPLYTFSSSLSDLVCDLFSHTAYPLHLLYTCSPRSSQLFNSSPMSPQLLHKVPPASPHSSSTIPFSVHPPLSHSPLSPHPFRHLFMPLRALTPTPTLTETLSPANDPCAGLDV